MDERNISLSVNLNKIALIRNSRDGNYPSVAEFGQKAIDLGVAGLTVHPRPDQRHIRPSDVLELSKLCRNAENVEFNIEGNPFAGPADGESENYPGLLTLVEQTLPEQCTLVPDNNSQKTSDHGFDLTKSFEELSPIIAQLKQLNVRISLFMDPDVEQIKLAKAVGADRIELYTGPFAWAYEKDRAKGIELFDQYREAAEQALSEGLGINAGHDLNLENMQLFRDLPGLQEVSIGHALTVDALHLGYEAAVKAYLEVCR